MIETIDQYWRTLIWKEIFRKAQDDLENGDHPVPKNVDPLLLKAMKDSIRSQHQELLAQLAEWEKHNDPPESQEI